METEVIVKELKPYDYLKESVGKDVKITCRNETELRGKLRAYDLHQNLFLSDVTEQVITSKREFEVLFVRGDQVIAIENMEDNQ